MTKYFLKSVTLTNAFCLELKDSFIAHATLFTSPGLKTDHFNKVISKLHSKSTKGK